MSAPTALELLWGGGQRRRRGPKPSLSLEQIVTAAIELSDVEGLANLSMQRLAEKLGCAKMALYRYVPGKTELTALMLDAGIGRPPELPATQDVSTEEPWRARLRLWTVTLFERMSRHPWSLELSLGVRPFGPNEMDWTETALAALADTPLTASQRLDAVVLLVGHARNLAQQAIASPTTRVETGLADALAATLAAHPDRYPHTLTAFAQSTEPSDRDQALTFGIDRILDGLAALADPGLTQDVDDAVSR